jgi:hypothetical protein
MKADKYSVKDFFVNRYLEQIIIPEIQRDYVWGKEQVTGLLNSIKDDFLNYQNKMPTIQAGNDQTYIDFYKRKFLTSNIGFIYAYNDDQYPDRYFLIDGQQRITTIFLTMLVLAKRNKLLKERFKRTFYNNEISKLDYKVRETSHDFLINFIPFSLDRTGDIKDQKWYYSEYEQDKTIQSIICNFKNLYIYFDSLKVNEEEFYKYIEDYTELRYFDTNLSEQGEELYIYMNARGEQIQSHENLKAELLSRVIDSNNAEKNKYGAHWEEWQDFFWQHKSNNDNADRGFNEFLACISGMKRYLDEDLSGFYTKEVFEKNNQIKISHIIENLSILDIQRYISGLQYLESNKNEFKNLYGYNSWVEPCLQEIWDILNKETTNWYANYSDRNRATEQSKMVFIWSVLYFLSISDMDRLDVSQSFRVLRMYYLRFKNFNRSVSTIKNTINLLHLNGVFDSIDNEINGTLDENGDVINIPKYEETDNKIRTKEEIKKIELLNRYIDNPTEQRKIEEIIWQIEDHKLNLNGKDVGGINISHLVDLNSNLTIDDLILIRDKFYELFSKDQLEYLTLQNVLLYYGEYWNRSKPDYYQNLKFDDWKNIIRCRYDGIVGKKMFFRNFFTDFLIFKGDIEAFYETKKKETTFMDEHESRDILVALMWYNKLLGSRMWSHGNYIALRDWTENDKVFGNIKMIFNTQGDFRGYKNCELFNLISDDIKNSIIKSNSITLSQNKELPVDFNIDIA